MPYAPARPGLTVSTMAVDAPGALLDLLPADGPLAWVRDGEGLVGWGQAARVELSGPDPWSRAAAWWAELVAGLEVVDEVGLPGCGPVAFGSFAFDAERGTSVLVVPEVVVGHRDGTWWVTSVGPVPELAPARDVRAPSGLRLGQGARSGPEWVEAVAEAVRRIRAGRLDKVVLARDVTARADAPVDVRWPLQQLARDYPGCWTFAVDGLVGATPELLLRLREARATSRVLAGTLRRSGDLTRDLRQGDALARSIKDVEEHGYGVRSVVDALAPHCGTVEVPPSPFVLKLPNVMHLATDVTGTVVDGSTSLELVASLHPSAAVCGSPTPVALELIRELEGMDRGRYAGPVGWLDASGDGEWGIALRCGQVDPADPARVRLFAGCGIVGASRPVDELAESEAKLVPMRSALGAGLAEPA